MKNSATTLLMLLVFVTNLCADQKIKNAHKHAAQLAQHNTEFFTGSQSVGNFDSSDTLTASVLTTNNAQSLPEVAYGNPKTAKVKLTIYSAATCTHCAGYDNDTVPQLMKLVKAGDLLLVLRPFIAHAPWDLLATQISWAKGYKHQHNLFGKFLRNHQKWLQPVIYNKDDKNEAKAYINKLNSALVAAAHKTGFSVQEIKAKLLIPEDDPAGLLKVFAITDLGLNIDDIQKVLEDKDFERKILMLTLDARDGDKLVNFTPAMYVQKHPQNPGQGVLQSENLEYDAVVTLIQEAKNNI
ncbi:MAG: hypothetical protein COY39_01970 [Alphaproteobacteria bacterium CG_4_10_14_0_8_um_filter_37_21]|nr:MAG: hypothetical protein COY39_01970 [Alphaproteobacteria bacterium CG_4_10_14_0_8_um_filter_37_21]